MEDCIFCKIVKGEIPAERIYEDDSFVAFPDANPQVEGHCLIVPKKHFVNIMDLPSSLGGELLDTIKKVAEMMMKEGFEGFSLVMNNFVGQAVMHAHVHLLPRKKGDGFKLVG
jgi:histidine triad (HIT) family protein